MRLMRRKPPQILSNVTEAPPADARQETFVRPANLDLALEIAVRAALQHSDASGAAIALMGNEALVCRARGGNIAPDLGVRLDVNAGITGACVRSAAVLHCEDTESDQRVDSMVCRALGIRSILVVPVLDKRRVIGVVEVLSAKHHAFGSEHIHWLEKLAEFIRDLSSTRAVNASASASLLAAVATSEHGRQSAETEEAMDLRASLADESPAVPPDAGLGAFLSVLPKSSPSSTWDELCQELASRMKVIEKI
jgi:putative methionine-R-sulfoxide reductase with GAF domain